MVRDRERDPGAFQSLIPIVPAIQIIPDLLVVLVYNSSLSSGSWHATVPNFTLKSLKFNVFYLQLRVQDLPRSRGVSVPSQLHIREPPNLALGRGVAFMWPMQCQGVIFL